MAVELQKRLENHLGMKLPATVAFDHPTVDDLAMWVLGRFEPILQEEGRNRYRPRQPSSPWPLWVVVYGCRVVQRPGFSLECFDWCGTDGSKFH